MQNPSIHFSEPYHTKLHDFRKKSEVLVIKFQYVKTTSFFKKARLFFLRHNLLNRSVLKEQNGY
jgi:hypothetical protein